MDTTEKPDKKRPGRVAQGYERYNVMLPPDLADWLKHQPGGMSETIRRLATAARESAERDTK